MSSTAQPPQPKPPVSGVPTEPNKNAGPGRAIILSIAAVVAVTCVVTAIMALSELSDLHDDGGVPFPQPTPTGCVPSYTPNGQVPGHMNQPALDCYLEITLTKIECGISQVGLDNRKTAASNRQFCLLHVTVTNKDSQTQTLYPTNQYVRGPGSTYTAVSNAGDYLGHNANVLKNIDPGRSVFGVLLFDIPQDEEIGSVLLMASGQTYGVSYVLG